MHVSTPARLAALLAVAVIAGACGSGSSAGSSAGAGSGAVSAGSIEISDAWARTSPMVSGAGAAYMVIKNTGSEADALLGGSSPAAKSVEVHETYLVEESPAASMGMGGMESPEASMDGGMGSGSSGGMMGMRRIESLEIPAGGSVELKPGGYHIMMIELTAPLKAGDKVEITLNFAKAGDVKVTADVKDM
jgi:periplasmic copper chaperone A